MDAVILIDKPAAITSAEAVRRVKRQVKPNKVGHLGTLDPFATGLLPIMVGEATKLAPFLERGNKEYEGVIRLGAETDTLDRDGAVMRTAEVPALTSERLAEAAARFTGRISQVPPVFSAIKREGVPMYKLARRDASVEAPPPREVEIHSLAIEAIAPDALRFTAVCSKGTYARSLARDIGAALGTAAYLADLRRTRTSGFSLADAVALELAIESLESGTELPTGSILSPRQALATMREAAVGAAIERRLRSGDSSALDMIIPVASGCFKVISEAGDLIAVARATSRATAVIERIFNP